VVYTIARDTGWSEEFILWQLPLPRALQYYHCALQAAGLWTLEPPDPQAAREMVSPDLLAHIDALVDAQGDDDG
jgi:hypothetical protein